VDAFDDGRDGCDEEKVGDVCPGAWCRLDGNRCAIFPLKLLIMLITPSEHATASCRPRFRSGLHQFQFIARAQNASFPLALILNGVGISLTITLPCQPFDLDVVISAAKGRAKNALSVQPPHIDGLLGRDRRDQVHRRTVGCEFWPAWLRQ